MATFIPPDHPRAGSLRVRERMSEAVKAGIVHPTGLIAHGRGEAFDYLLGERTGPTARRAVAWAADVLCAAKRPVLSVNGNVAALAARDMVLLSEVLPARLEVNLFHRSDDRVARVIALLEAAGARDVLGRTADMRVPGLASDRAGASSEGIGGADVVLVPLEDGDRTAALSRMGKTVVAIDLNPLSRTALAAHVTIVEEITRALPLMAAEVRARRSAGVRPGGLSEALSREDNARILAAARAEMADRLRSLA